VGTARAGLRRWPLKPSERAAMRAAKEHVARISATGPTPEQVAQARAELQAPELPRQPQLPLKVRQ
jgi:hypothetical protein